MENCPKLSNKLIVLIKKALQQEVFDNRGTLDELIKAYHLPPRVTPPDSNSEFTDVEKYYRSAVLDLEDPKEQSEHAAVILAALIDDCLTDSPVLEKMSDWSNSSSVRRSISSHVNVCIVQLRQEGIKAETLVAFAAPIIRGRVELPAATRRVSSSKEGAPAAPTLAVAGQFDPARTRVFIVHGHDELNVHKLRDYLRDELKLVPVVMSFEAGKGRTLIEKFEQEAEGIVYAFALLTPDDVVQTANGQYAQARPNVAFELGWFYGRLGRQNVCILLKKGAQIHSDLDGISQIKFGENVTEKAIEIERELRAAGIILRQIR
jgi:predicted nucleotide-binding protein